jgi:hypothetical protein
MGVLLDHLIDALPVMGELTAFARPHLLERELRELLPLVPETWRLVSSLGVVAVLKYLGLAATGTFMTIYGAHLAMAPRATQDVSTVKIEVGEFKVAWQGVAGVGCMVGGVLVLVSAFWLHQVNLPGPLALF